MEPSKEVTYSCETCSDSVSYVASKKQSQILAKRDGWVFIGSKVWCGRCFAKKVEGRG